MQLAVKKIESFVHPLIQSAYLKRNDQGNTLIIETNFDFSNDSDPLDSLLADLDGLLHDAESDNVTRLDYIDIRKGAMADGNFRLH